MKIILTAVLAALLVWAMERVALSKYGPPEARCINAPTLMIVPVPAPPQKGQGT